MVSFTADGSVSGQWSESCSSSTDDPNPNNTGFPYARYYTFTLDASATVTIDLESRIDTYLYLRSENATSGDTEAVNDDHDNAGLASTTDSQIVATLETGTWTIEATTYDAGDEGSFTLTVRGIPSGTALPTSTPAPGTTPTLTPTPGSTPTLTPTTPPASGQILRRDVEYTYSFELTDDWESNGRDSYKRDSPTVRIKVFSQMLADGSDLNQFAQSVQNGLEGDWWPDASTFEIDSVEDGEIDGYPMKRIRYRVEEAPRYCTLDVEELVVVAQILPGNPHGFRLRAWTCEGNVERHGRLWEDILESFRVAFIPAAYYQQFISVKGVTVRADETVDPAAVEAAAEIVDVMLSGREDIAPCMARNRGDFAIIPEHQVSTDLPEFQDLEGSNDWTGRRRDTFDIRGLGGTRSRPSTAGEEQLLGTWEIHHPWYPTRGKTAVHEYAHGIENVCFTQADSETWNGLYEAAKEENLYPGTHMMARFGEFFAGFTEAYFEVDALYDEENPSREKLRQRFPEVYQALDDIYLGATLPEKFRIRHPRPSNP